MQELGLAGRTKHFLLVGISRWNLPVGRKGVFIAEHLTSPPEYSNPIREKNEEVGRSGSLTKLSRYLTNSPANLW